MKNWVYYVFLRRISLCWSWVDLFHEHLCFFPENLKRRRLAIWGESLEDWIWSFSAKQRLPLKWRRRGDCSPYYLVQPWRLIQPVRWFWVGKQRLRMKLPNCWRQMTLWSSLTILKCRFPCIQKGINLWRKMDLRLICIWTLFLLMFLVDSSYGVHGFLQPRMLFLGKYGEVFHYFFILWRVS